MKRTEKMRAYIRKNVKKKKNSVKNIGNVNI